ncbi:MAG: ABC transporter permease, partial [Hyphomicrobiales bacterium]
VPMLADERAIYDGFASRYPGYLADMQWHVFANVGVLNRGNFERARDDLVGLYREFEPYRVYSFSPLKDTLDSFGETADYQQTPLIILLLQITGIALFYVGLVAAIVVERQSQEIALLRSRGATLAQIAGIYAAQGLFLGIPALFLAPFIAAAATAFLGVTPAFSNVSNGDLLPVTILPVSFALAAAGVLLALLALLAPVVAVAMRGSLAIRRAESRPGRSFIQRYYLDLALAAAAILLLVELRQRDTVFEPSATGGVSSDPLLLASPALAIAAASAIILRLNPLLLRVFARAARVAAAPAMALGLWQLVRNSGQYTRLALLLMMAVAVGTFAASYTTTTEKSYRDRANYQAGADFRAFSATGRAPSLSTADFDRRVRDLPGVEKGTVIVRSTAGFATPGTTSQGFQLLGIDADTAGPMLWYRDDFAGPPLPDVLREVNPSPLRKGLPLPEGAAALSLWVRAQDSLDGVNVRAGVRDSTGRYVRIDLGEMQAGSEWQQLAAPLEAEFQAPLQQPLELISLTFSEPTNRAGERILYIDDIQALDAAGNATPVETFEAQAPWTTMPDRASTQDEFVGSPDGAHSGTTGARYTFRQGVSTGLRGVYYNNFMSPLPAVASRSFLDTTGLSAGATALLQVGIDTLVPIVIRGSFNLLPTTVSEEGPVVVVDRDSLVQWSAIVSPFATEEIDANEAWFDLAPGADEAALEQALRADPFNLGRSVSRARELQRAEDNPLIAAGGSGILAIAFVAVLGLVAVALITQLLASVTRRRVELAVVRALGLSRGQVLRMLALEYGVVILLGVVAGVVLGLFVSGQMLSFLDVTEAGTRVEPPFQLQTRWLVVIGAAALVAASCAAALVAVARQLTGPNEARALRTE